MEFPHTRREDDPMYISPDNIKRMENTTGATNIENAGYVQPEHKHYGFYQLCPKCNGEGEIIDRFFPLTKRQCDVCNGSKLLVRPEIKEGEV